MAYQCLQYCCTYRLVQCASSKKIQKKMKNPLKFVILQQVGSQSQVDFIDMRSYEVKEMKWILHYVDCLSGFSHIRAK